jgi:hypothetical protein
MDISTKDWAARWSVSLTTPLYSLRMRNEIDVNMRLFAKRLPEYHAALMAGILSDLILTLDPEDPWRNLYRDNAGTVRLPGGETFGMWENATDLMPAGNADKGVDLSLAPLTEPLSSYSAELLFVAAKGWDHAMAYLLEAGVSAADEQNIFELAEDAIRWALLRRQAYALDGDGFFPVTAAAWLARISKVVAGEPFDEARMYRLRNGASIEAGTYDHLV